jgi:hypothetical protein
MKKLFVFATAALLVSGAAFAGGGDGKEKGKKCCKKEGAACCKKDAKKAKTAEAKPAEKKAA